MADEDHVDPAQVERLLGYWEELTPWQRVRHLKDVEATAAENLELLTWWEKLPPAERKRRLAAHEAPANVVPLKRPPGKH